MLRNIVCKGGLNERTDYIRVNGSGYNFSTVISFIISRRQGSLQYITGERKEWREQIRNIAYNLNNASYGKTLKILIELKVRINGFGMNRKNCMEDAHIWEVIHEIEKEKPSNEILNRRQKQLIEYISLLLKYDWERSKREIRGNTYKVLSMIILQGQVYILPV